MSQQINLFNPAFLKQKKLFTAATMARALVLLLLGALALVMVGRNSVMSLEAEAAAGARQLAIKKARQATVMVEFAPRKKDPQIDADIGLAQAEKASFDEVMRILDGGELGNTEGYSQYFTALARQVNGELWLTGVSIQGAGNQIGLRGRAMEPSLVPAYISRLTRETSMRGKGFGALQITRGTLATQGRTGVELAPFIDFSLQAVPEKAVPGTQAAEVGQ